MKHSNWAVCGTGILLALTVAGCGDSSTPSLTPAQEQAARHPVADPNYKGPTDSDRAKMTQAVTEWQAKHANDKLEYSK